MLKLRIFQKIFGLVISMIVTLLLILGIEEYHSQVIYTEYTLLIYFLFDLFITNEIEMYIHHAAVCNIIISSLFINHNPSSVLYLTKMFLYMEVSSIFLNFRNLIKEMPFKYKIVWYMNINDILFFLSFLVFRSIFSIYYIMDLRLYNIMLNEASVFDNISILSIIALNSIWTIKIIRIAYKQLMG